MRDARRLVVALSRARLGLYVFGRASLFAPCFELAPAFKQLLAKPTALQLVLGERWPFTPRAPDDDLSASGEAKAGEAAAHTVSPGGAASELGALVHSMAALLAQAQAAQAQAAQAQAHAAKAEAPAQAPQAAMEEGQADE